MTTVETSSMLLGAIVLTLGVPLAVFHRAIATELARLRAHFVGSHHDKGGRHAHSHRRSS